MFPNHPDCLLYEEVEVKQKLLKNHKRGMCWIKSGRLCLSDKTGSRVTIVKTLVDVQKCLRISKNQKYDLYFKQRMTKRDYVVLLSSSEHYDQWISFIGGTTYGHDT